MAQEVVLKTIFQFKRGQSEAWTRVNPILRAAEPGYELDTGRLKIGNGSTAWNDLEYYGGDVAISADGKSLALVNDQLALYGFENAAAGQTIRKADDGTLEWYTPVTQEDIDKIETILQDLEDVDDQLITLKEDVLRIDASALTIQFEISDVPEGTLVDHRDKEIRVMCPQDTVWVQQEEGSNLYYMTLRAYAPINAVSFKKGDQGVIVDTVYDFSGADGGVDEFGRKYSTTLFTLASYDESTATWVYFGANSTEENYFGWDYCIEWYDENGVRIDYDAIRINLSNENCHFITEDYYFNKYQTITDPISIDRLINSEGEPIIFDGGIVEE